MSEHSEAQMIEALKRDHGDIGAIEIIYWLNRAARV